MGNVIGVAALVGVGLALAAYYLNQTSETPMRAREGTYFTSRSATDNSRNNEEIRNYNSRHTNENTRNTSGSAENTYYTSSNMRNRASNAENTYHTSSNITRNTNNTAENANNNIRSAMGNTVNTAEDGDSSSRNTTNNPTNIPINTNTTNNPTNIPINTNTANNRMNIPINTNTTRNATNENQNITRHSTNDVTGHMQSEGVTEKSRGNATPQKVKSYASIVKSGNNTKSSLNNTGRHAIKRFVSTATSEKRVVYHYTNRAGAGWISSTGYIKESSETSSFAHFGKGVYLTTLPPSVGKERIAKNNWTKGWETRMDSGKVDFAIRVAVPERKLIKCEAHDRDLFLHKGPLFLANYPEWELEMVTSEAGF